MPESDLALLSRAAQAAAETATRYIGAEMNVRHKAADGSPVTDADMAVNTVLADILRAARPGYGWLSEESADDPDRLGAEHVFIVDPIDGTRSFIEGSDSWSHSLAVARDGEITAAVVFLPMRDKLYSAARGEGTRLNDAPVQASDVPALASAHVLATRPTLAPEHWRASTPEIRRSHRPSIAYRLGLVAEGRFDAMFTFRQSWEWDIAAGALLLSEAGARLTDRRGAPIRFNAARPLHDGVVAANPALHDDILAQLRPDH
ncbi:MAG: 3'(2'),5'-bisphosphate nucleotidase CysQ [Rhodobacteraceae bacterium]|uniref:Myo-inositol-1(Or 4)-monophosphatase n=1 Tax=Salipiger profundus TaxID=1229727 RepID=A0A1U7CZX7_9RHOB|nr:MULTISPECIES: 3'(2'),5'-bisphosphate nucleotidase CysQ [Salipiger]APX21457.1 myo-inositol-1(or 4)-monophosphatase [Salipiger profundus]MAB08864.1 3'(2'),5'-bisphosphate nucleotidase CysQ [Paracoccaceae bacterium]GGA02250.1 3'(2'),5'-bisphosphate nucleotidase CysQ [Salipiger profundus]SFC20011.1 myo-inositol-1(or 4)-monophosphatase [Salipiger profundus]